MCTTVPWLKTVYSTFQDLNSNESLRVTKYNSKEWIATLSWPSLESPWKNQICFQIFKCLNGFVPAYLLHDFHYSNDFHACNTLSKDLLHLSLAKTSKYQCSFRYEVIAWNKLSITTGRSCDNFYSWLIFLSIRCLICT